MILRTLLVISTSLLLQACLNDGGDDQSPMSSAVDVSSVPGVDVPSNDDRPVAATTDGEAGSATVTEAGSDADIAEATSGPPPADVVAPGTGSGTVPEPGTTSATGGADESSVNQSADTSPLPDIAVLPVSPSLPESATEPLPVTGPEVEEPPISPQPIPSEPASDHDLPLPPEFLSGSSAGDLGYVYICHSESNEVVLGAAFLDDRTGYLFAQDETIYGSWTVSGNSVSMTLPDLQAVVTFGDIVFTDTYTFATTIGTQGSRFSCEAFTADGPYGVDVLPQDRNLTGLQAPELRILDSIRRFTY